MSKESASAAIGRNDTTNFNLFSKEGTMKRTILYVVGMLASAGWGFAIYNYTGLADAFESEVVSYAIGFAIAVVFVSVFRSACLNSGRAPRKERSEEERIVFCSECRRKFEPEYSQNTSQNLALP